jgi:indolepyruvate ferredoxin oxidoreductase alpha subunit
MNEPGSSVLLNGDEAVARGALEAGITVAASYPGTPATEILEALAQVAGSVGLYVEWSPNEIVATGVAAGAAMTGVRALVAMKHVGLNVASDAVMTLAYTGVKGGMVIAVCDDPSMHSSQNEQDTRYFAMHSNLPLLDAANPQEAKDMTFKGFELSERLQLPIIVRLTTRVAHGKGRVRLGKIHTLHRKATFDKDASRWTMVPLHARRQHRILYQRLAEAAALAEASDFNVVEDNSKDVGVIGSGVAYYYARSVLDTRQYSWLKLGFLHPFPEALVTQFLSTVQKALVVEELRPYVEDRVRCLGGTVLGKRELRIGEVDELTPDILRDAFSRHGFCAPGRGRSGMVLPSRPPVLCPGCPHRAFFATLNMAAKDKIVTGDIGCYTLGTLPPLNTVQSCLCMGAGISQAAGMRHAGEEGKIFAVIGDSTFFHAGMPALLNVAYNDADICVVILDNGIVAMTGHQPTPGTGVRVTGETTRAIQIEDVVTALGIEKVKVVDPYRVAETQTVIEEILSEEGPSVIISKRPCVLTVDRGEIRRVSAECTSCGVCVQTLGCPAISMVAGKAEIDAALCRGCGVCEEVCPSDAIVRGE